MGCSTVHEAIFGKEYSLETLATSNLGITTKDEIIQILGNPLEIEKRWFDSFDAEIYFYQGEYTKHDSNTSISTRSIACEFNKGVLTAYRLYDSSPSAQQDVDDKERSKLIKGTSTHTDVQNVFGNPMGKALLPSTITQASLAFRLGGAPFPLAKIPDETREVWQYYSETRSTGGEKTAQKTYSVYFDAKGLFIGTSQLQQLSMRP